MPGGFGSGGFGGGPYGSLGDVIIVGPAATITTQAWTAGIDNGFPIANLSGSGHTVTLGDSTVVLGIFSGSFRDWFYVGGLTTSPTVDPLLTSVIGISYPAEVNTGWVRGALATLSPAGFWTFPGTEDSYRAGISTQVWPRAARGVMGVYFTNTANGEQHYIDDAQFESGTSNSAYDSPRDTKIAIIPDRINAVAKQQYTSGPTTPITATSATMVVTGAGLNVTWNATPALITYPVTIPTDLNKGWCTASVYVYNPPVALQIQPVAGGTFYQGFETFSDLTTRIWCSYPIGVNGVADFTVSPTYGGFAGTALFPDGALYPDEDLFPAGGTYIGTTTLINKFMAEAAPNMGDYFDSTYQYTNDIVVGASGAVSFFDNKKVKNYRLTQILNQTMPIGATFTLSYKSY